MYALLFAIAILFYFIYPIQTEGFCAGGNCGFINTMRKNWIPFCNNYMSHPQVDGYLQNYKVNNNGYYGNPDQVFSKTFPNNCF